MGHRAQHDDYSVIGFYGVAFLSATCCEGAIARGPSGWRGLEASRKTPALATPS